jgi:choline dehydrogenase-like flavoprotein
MLIDAPAMTPGSAVDAAVCVVGAGPLGIATALALADAGLDVVLLESGGLDHRPELASLEEPAEIHFARIASLGNTRQFGGNANAWQVRNGISQRGVRVVPLTEADFEGHSGRPGSAWPFGLPELAPYLDRAEQFFGLPLAGYEGADWADSERVDQLVDDPDIRTRVFKFPEGGDLVARSAATVRNHPRVRLITGATALEVLTDADALATGVRAATAPGREFTVRAGRVVLAAGTATTTQLLLASDAVRPAGLGNSSDLVGRYFMDHLLLRGGRFIPARRTDLDHRDFYDIRIVNGVPVMGHLQLSDEALRRGDLLNLSFVMLPRSAKGAATPSPRQAAGTKAALALRESVIRRRLPSRRVLAQLARGLDGAVAQQLRSLRRPEASLGRGGWSSLAGRPSQRYSHFDIMHQAEQAPHEDNRMTLSDERDPLGLRKLVIDWRWHDEDAAATVRAQQTFARALARLGWGEFEIASANGRPVVHSHSSNHFMGTTRMNASPERGVVDPRGAVHGTPNLYIASSSVFPSGGFANVTLSAVAVALRTADAVIADSAAVVPAPVAPSGR